MLTSSVCVSPVLHAPVGKIESVRSTRPVRVPTVLTAEEARQVIAAMSGTPQLGLPRALPRSAQRQQ